MPEKTPTYFRDFLKEFHVFRDDMSLFKTDMESFKNKTLNFQIEMSEFRNETKAEFEGLNIRLDGHAQQIASVTERVTVLEKLVLKET